MPRAALMKRGAANAKTDSNSVLVRAKPRLARSGVVHPLSSIYEHLSGTRDRSRAAQHEY